MCYHSLLNMHVIFPVTYLSAKLGIDRHSSQKTMLVVSSWPSQLHRSRHWGWNRLTLFFSSYSLSLSLNSSVDFLFFSLAFLPGAWPDTGGLRNIFIWKTRQVERFVLPLQFFFSSLSHADADCKHGVRELRAFAFSGGEPARSAVWLDCRLQLLPKAQRSACCAQKEQHLVFDSSSVLALITGWFDRNHYKT